MSIQQYVSGNVKALAPIAGVSFGSLTDTATWRIDYTDEATQAEKDSAQAYIDSLDLASLQTATESELWKEKITEAYDQAMLKLQNGYSNEEVKTFAVKQDAINEYVAGGVAGLSAQNRLMVEALTDSTDSLVLAAKLDSMREASKTFKTYLATIERVRDVHLDQLVEGADNSAVIDSLTAAYAALAV